MTDVILTNAGQYFPFDEPEKYNFRIDEIAHALSNLCRFTGHCRSHYSVAQHSVIVSHIVSPDIAMIGLLHDAAEAYIGDVASPLKRKLKEYKAIEERVEAALFKQFGIPYPLPPEVKEADIAVMLAERRDLMPPTQGRDEVWPKCAVPLMARVIVPMSQPQAKQLFLNRYNSLRPWR